MKITFKMLNFNSFSFQADELSDLYSNDFWNFDQLQNFRQFSSQRINKRPVSRRTGTAAAAGPRGRRRRVRKRARGQPGV